MTAAGARVNRAINFYLVAVLSIAGAAALPALKMAERNHGHLDDSALVILALAGVTWYLGAGKHTRKLTPFVLVLLAALGKLGGALSRQTGPASPDAVLAVFLGAGLVVAAGWRRATAHVSSAM